MDYKKMYEDLQKENEKLKKEVQEVVESTDKNEKMPIFCDSTGKNGVYMPTIKGLGLAIKTYKQNWKESESENEKLQKEITSLKKALEYTKKNKVNVDDDPFLPESQDVGGLDTDTV
jgi:cell division septum initiation protein DivIVA